MNRSGVPRAFTRRLLVPLVGLALAASAVTAMAGVATGATKPSGDPVKLMVIYERDQGAAFPEVPDGAIAAAKALNRKGGINGRPVQIIVCDTHNDPNTAGECGRKAVQQKVVALVGQSSAQSGSFLPLMVENKIPSVGALFGGAADVTSDVIFPTSGGGGDSGGVTSAAALPGILHEKTGAIRISLVVPDIAGAADGYSGILNTALERFDLKLANAVSVPIGAPDMSPYVAAALKDGTDGIVVSLVDQDAVNFLQAARQASPEVALGLLSAGQSVVAKSLGKDTKNVYKAATTLPQSVKNPANQQFAAELKAAGFNDLSGQRKNSWASVQVVAKVADGMPALTGPALYDKLSTATDVRLGFQPPLQFVTGGVGGIPRVFNPCVLAVKLENGADVPITGKFFDAFTGQECPLTG